MEEALVARWNAKVKKDDTVWFLGDFAFANLKMAERILLRLNGFKKLQVGNHDPKRLREMDHIWYEVRDAPTLVNQGHNRLVLFHYPMMSWPYSTMGAIHLHGHSHGTYPQASNRIDVGVDCWDYEPVTWAEIDAARQNFPKQETTT